MTTLFGHIDCKYFYWRCEELFDPTLRGKPGVVLSNNDGCAVALNDAAKALGLVRGSPWFQVRDGYQKAGGVARSSNYTLYGDMSGRVMKTLSRFTPNMEVYSIDEAFLDFAGFGNRLEAHAREAKATVEQHTGILVRVGVAPTKTLAKVANRTAKKTPGEVCLLLTEAEQTAALAKMELSDVWGVAGRLAARLEALGITTPLQLRDANPRFIRERFNVVLERTVLELQGVPCIDLEKGRPDSKTIAVTRSFGEPVTCLEQMQESLAVHTTYAAEKARKQGLAPTAVIVFITTNHHDPRAAQYYAQQFVQLATATADTCRLIRAAHRGLAAIWRPGYVYKKAGVLFPELVKAEGVQGDLFSQADTSKSKALMAALDQINQHYGRHTVRPAPVGFEHKWKLRAEYISKCYTTSAEDFPRV